MELATVGPGASGNGVRTVTAPRSALGSGVTLHAYDITVLVVYFVFVIGVGVWVSSPRGWGLTGQVGQALISGWWWSWGQGGQKEGRSGKHRAKMQRPSEIHLSRPFFYRWAD